MKPLAVALLFGSIAMAAPVPQACGAQDIAFKVSKDKSPHAAPTPANGRATLVVFGWGKLAIDGKIVGAVNGTYSFSDLEAGEHHLCGWWSGLMPLPVILVPTKIREISLHSLDAKPGETYYIYLTGINVPRQGFQLEVLDRDDANYKLAKFEYGTSQPK